jgi:hypothetical protein
MILSLRRYHESDQGASRFAVVEVVLEKQASTMRWPQGLRAIPRWDAF